jgi:hypothetical protein
MVNILLCQNVEADGCILIGLWPRVVPRGATLYCNYKGVL